MQILSDILDNFSIKIVHIGIKQNIFNSKLIHCSIRVPLLKIKNKLIKYIIKYLNRKKELIFINKLKLITYYITSSINRNK